MSDRAVAIVGASCRFPGAAGLEAFWQLLIDGRDAVTEIADARWPTRRFYHPRQGEPGKTYTWAAGLIDGIDLFDPGFFGISPREAAQMDPQQRLLLELAWHAIEDAGITAASLAGSAAGVYVGASSTDYGDLRLGDPASGDAHFVTGMALSILANRLSHVFDLRGPSLAIDTACSSSLVALHYACEALRAGRTDTALVGGVNLLLSPYPFVGFAQAAMLSRQGRCFAFDARADGYVRSEGGAVVVLKRLQHAIADGDPIRAVIRATETNASGRTFGLSLPNEAAQADLLRSVYARAEIAADALGFVEMHGTGTPAGDPVEAAAVGSVLGQPRSAPLPIGSVKTNIGHLEPASGLAGLLKAALALERGVLPASLHCHTPNPAIPFERLNLRVARTAEPVVGVYAGVNSFGFGGANAHAVLAAPPRPAKLAGEGMGLPPLLVSARSAASLRALAKDWRDALSSAPPAQTPLLLRAAARRRDHHLHRLVALGADPGAALGDFLAGKDNPNVASGTALREGRVAFVFSGNGAQFLGMGREAYRASAVFREALAAPDRALAPLLGWSVAARIASGINEEECRRADIAQPMLWAIQTAIVRVLRGFGIRPQCHIGHSVGEIAAAWAAEALSLDDAARIVAMRSRHQEGTRGTGRMAAVALGETDARVLLAATGAALDIAAINSPRAVTVSGPAVAIAAFCAEAARNGVACRELDLDFAFHSAAMEPLRAEMLADFGAVSPGRPDADLISTVTGQRIETGRLDAGYWWRNIREPVRFADAVAALIAEGHRIFVEIGPTPVLISYLRDSLDAAEIEGRVTPTLNRRDPPGDPFPAIAAQLHAAGCDLSRAPVFDGPNDPHGLPLYPWQRRRHWAARTVEATDALESPSDHPLLGSRRAGERLAWVNHLDTAVQPFLADHRIDGTPVLPAAAIIDMALTAARAAYPTAATLQLADMELQRPMAFEEGRAREVHCDLSPDGDWQLESRPRLADEPMTIHATARLGFARTHSLAEVDGGPTIERFVDGETLYREAARLGLDYGPCFRAVRRVTLRGQDRAMVDLDPSSCAALEPCLIQPALLDGALQGLLVLLENGDTAAGFLPRRFGKVSAFAPFGRSPVRAELRLTRRGVRSVSADISLFDREALRVAELTDCWFSRVELTRFAVTSNRLLHIELVPAPLSDPPAPPILDRIGEIVSRLAAERGRDAAHEAEQALLLDALVAAVAKNAVHEVVADEAPFTIAELIGDGRIAKEAAPLLGRLLTLLARFGAATVDGGRWRFAATDDLPEIGALWRTSLAEAPDMVAELALIAAAAEGLPRTLKGRQRLADTAAMVAHLRCASPPSAAGIAVIEAALSEIATQWPRPQRLRLFSVNGDGPTSRMIDRLARSGTRRVNDAERCDVAVSVNGSNPPTRINLAPGGVFLAIRPLPSPLWDLVPGGLAEDWREALTAGGFIDTGAADVAAGPWPIEALWARAPMSEPPVPEPAGSLSLGLVSGHDVSAFAGALAAQGHKVRTIDPDAADDARDAVILAVGPADDRIAATARLLPAFARVAASAASHHTPLWLVTAGSQQGGGEAGAALWAFGRVLLNEIPGLSLHLLDLPPALPASEQARTLARELAATGEDIEIVWTADGRHVQRLQRGLPPHWADRAEMLTASVQLSRGLDRIAWVPAKLCQPGRGEIEIDIHAAGINFRDLMWANGILPEEALIGGFAGAALGLECAGVVRAVGPDVDDVSVGDRVAGFAPSALASRVVTRADAVIAIPPEMSFAAAATLPVAFVTASYALRTLAQAKPGEHVLIHAASGAVGLAAIQVAKGMGATVIASAGSELKRAFLRLAGADHVCDSRDLEFIEAVRAATGGAGVDIVLNSLHGEAMAAGIELLQPFGRFIELGKRDFFENRKLRLRGLRQNVSYFAIDIDKLPLQRPDLAKSLLADLTAMLAAGDIRPLAHRCFPFAEIAEALRLMQSADHVGKLVLVPHENAGIALPPTASLPMRKDGLYIVTGGLTGFGFAAAHWLARHGAGRLALVGRRGRSTPGAAERIAQLEAAGATVSVHAADIADCDSLTALLDQLHRVGPPICGVVHAAAAIVDGNADAIAPADAEFGLRAKLGGAVLLDRLTRSDPIELFCLFSSATSIVGAPGQGVYVAANAGLEALARRRHAEGLPALAIAWGAIEDTGYLAERPEQRKALSRRLGARAMTADIALGALPAMVASGLPVVVCADAEWHSAPHSLPVFSTPFFAEIRGAEIEPATDEALLDRLAALDSDAARDLIAVVVAGEAARILRLPADGIERQRPLAELGMDSLMAVELRLAIEKRLRIDLPLVALADGASVAALARQLAKLVVREEPASELSPLAAQHEAPLDPFALGGSTPERSA